MAPAIPDRWLDYTPVGKTIKGTRFIAFKVPLREHIVTSVPYEKSLSCRSLLDKIPNLGMIIDLTNTLRYYDPTTFQAKGIVYEKLMIPGRDIPKSEFVKKFNMLVNNFLQENANNAKLIGVHCTHGVNRTGYLISSFMISELKISPQEAIKCVEEARSHAIERQNYRNHLLRDMSRALETPSRSPNDNFGSPTASQPYDNNISQMTNNNFRSRSNWRDPQSYSSSSNERSLPENNRFRTNNYRSNRGNSQRSYYDREDDRRQYYRHYISYDFDGNQIEQNNSKVMRRKRFHNRNAKRY